MTQQTINLSSTPVALATAPTNTGQPPLVAQRIYIQAGSANVHRFTLQNSTGGIIKSFAAVGSSAGVILDDLDMAVTREAPWELFVQGTSGDTVNVSIWGV
jgi:hypothetical protein